MANLIFQDAEKARDAIMASQKKEIAQLYNDWADEVGKLAEHYKHKTTASSYLSELQMRQLKQQLHETSKIVSNEIHSKIKHNMHLVSDKVVTCNNEWLASVGFAQDGLQGMFSFVPDSIVRNIVTGQIYESGWSLSKRIWSDNEQILKDTYQIVAKGIAMNRPMYDIAKDLEQYVRPGAKMPWNLRAPDGKRIYRKQVDYNAQRLARTLVQHSYQQSVIATTKNNPFVTEYIWHSNGSRVCPLCAARDGQHFKKDELPMDHPNGMCVVEPAVVDNLVDQLADWYNSPDGTYPEIDAFAGKLGYTPSTKHIVKNSRAGTTEKAVEQKVVKQKDYSVRKIQSATKTLAKGCKLDDKTQQYIVDAIANTEREFKNMFVDALEKKVKDVMLTESSAYNRAYKRITFEQCDVDVWKKAKATVKDAHARQTLFHEVGHAMDDLCPGTGNVYSSSSKYGFKQAMLKDMKAMDDMCAQVNSDYINGLRKMCTSDSSKGVQDAISAMHCKGINLSNVKKRVPVRWRHSQEYYERNNAQKEAASELFANMCGAQVDSKAQEYMEQYFPNACEAFKNIIRDIGK